MAEEQREPAYYIKNEMEKEGMKAKELAELMGMKKQTLNNILNEYRRITTKTAIKLSKALPTTTPEYWMKRQMEYDLIKINQN